MIQKKDKGKENLDNNIKTKNKVKKQPGKRVRINRHRYWLITSFDVNFYKKLENNTGGISYYLGQLERGIEDGAEHWQVLVLFNNARYLEEIKRKFKDNTIHCEIIKNLKDSIDYCSKFHTYAGKKIEFGVKPEKEMSDKIVDKVIKEAEERRLLIMGLLDKVTEGRLSLEYIRKYTPKYYTEVYDEYIRQHNNAVRNRLVTLYAYGGAGLGKTLFCIILSEALGIKKYTVKSLKFFDGIEGDDECLFVDEFISSEMNLQEMNSLIDNNSSFLPVKHSYRRNEARMMFIGSNENYDDLYKEYSKTLINTFKRRLDVVVQFKNLDIKNIEIIAKFYDFNKSANLKEKKILSWKYCLDDGSVYDAIKQIVKSFCEQFFISVFNATSNNNKYQERLSRYLANYRNYFQIVTDS